jgi:hypothetical protein
VDLGVRVPEVVEQGTGLELHADRPPQRLPGREHAPGAVDAVAKPIAHDAKVTASDPLVEVLDARARAPTAAPQIRFPSGYVGR